MKKHFYLNKIPTNDPPEADSTCNVMPTPDLQFAFPFLSASFRSAKTNDFLLFRLRRRFLKK